MARSASARGQEGSQPMQHPDTGHVVVAEQKSVQDKFKGRGYKPVSEKAVREAAESTSTATPTAKKPTTRKSTAKKTSARKSA